MKLFIIAVLFSFNLYSQSYNSVMLNGYWIQSNNKGKFEGYKLIFDTDNQSVTSLIFVDDTLMNLSHGKFKINDNNLVIEYFENYNWIIHGYYKRDTSKEELQTLKFKLKNNKLILQVGDSRHKISFYKASIPPNFFEDFHKRNVELMFESSETAFFLKSYNLTKEIETDLLTYYNDVYFDPEDRRMFLLYTNSTINNETLIRNAQDAYEKKDFWLSYWFFRCAYLKTRDEKIHDKAMLAWNLNRVPVIYR